MSTRRETDVVIIGAGPAGLAAALYTGRAMLGTVVLERGVPGGELLNTEFLEDVPGFEKILGRDLAKRYHDHAAEFGADFQLGVTVSRVHKRADGYFETLTDAGDVYVSPAVIVTAGGTPLKLGIPGEVEYAGKGVSYCAVCDGAFYRGHHVVVVGGGDAACEEADYLTRFASKVTIIHRRNEFRASRIIQERVFANPKIEVIFNTIAEEALGDAVTGMTSLRVRNIVTGAVGTIAATGLFVFIGFKPNTGVIDGHYVHDAGGYVITDLAMQSSISGLFVAGDMRAQLTRQVTTAQGDATTAAIAADRYIKALKTGHPDPAAAVLGDIGVPRPRAPEGAAATGGAEAYGVAVGTGEATAR
ncbi:MAG TPA: FAD-dependent oxidoreductase [Gemmatimonadales bacterium]|nr:FAD-dependent oxidoreductase [Gemmatimonadales bacterium]